MLGTPRYIVKVHCQGTLPRHLELPTTPLHCQAHCSAAHQKAIGSVRLIDISHHRVSILSFLLHTTSPFLLKYSIRYYFTSDCSIQSNGISSVPSYLSRYPTRNSSFLIFSSQLILSTIFLAVRSFSFLLLSTLALSIWGILSLRTAQMKMALFLTMARECTCLFVIGFHSFAMEALITFVFLLRMTVSFWRHWNRMQSRGNLIFMGVDCSFAQIPSCPLKLLPHPYSVQFYTSSFSPSAIFSISFCCSLTFISPNLSSMYFLFIQSSIFPVTFSTFNIFTQSSNPYSWAQAITSWFVQVDVWGFSLSEAKKWNLPPVSAVILWLWKGVYSLRVCSLRSSMNTSQLARMQPTPLPNTMCDTLMRFPVEVIICGFRISSSFRSRYSSICSLIRTDSTLWLDEETICSIFPGNYMLSSFSGASKLIFQMRLSMHPRIVLSLISFTVVYFRFRGIEGVFLPESRSCVSMRMCVRPYSSMSVQMCPEWMYLAVLGMGHRMVS